MFSGLVAADEPPPNLVRLIAARESDTARARSNYTYRQTVTFDELNPAGFATGTYQEVRDVVFSPSQERSEQVVGKTFNTLTRIKMTDEDFADIRDVQPLLLRVRRQHGDERRSG